MRNRLTRKLIISAIIIYFVSSLIPTSFLMYYWFSNQVYLFQQPLFVISIICSYLLDFILLIIYINHILIKRIRQLKAATNKVMAGDFNLVLHDEKYDEISELTESFTNMANSLKNNEFLNKEFARNFTHEFKTPLSVINGYVGELKNNDLLAEDKLKYIQIIELETQRLSSLSQNILNLTMVDNYDIIEKNDNVQISEEIREIIQMTQIKWESRALDFILEMDDFYITTNIELMHQVFVNLIANAIKYAPEKTKIIIKLYKKDQDFYFTIKNYCIPIPNQELEKIFDVFYVGKSNGDSRSSGIGLALTKKIIGKLKGEIRVSQMNGIITFFVKLPVKYIN